VCPQFRFEKYGGTQKKLLKVQGTHSSLRTASCFDEISAFIHEHFLDDAARELYPKPLRVVPHMDGESKEEVVVSLVGCRL
jgi:hypothetical protein